MWASRLAILMWSIVGAATSLDAVAQDISFPQIIRVRYEANDSKTGGNFIIWIDRDRIWHGLDQRLYPAARYVDITHITPSPGSPPITMIEVGGVNSQIPEYYHAAGIVRFKITGMTLKSTNAPK
jgi:hypothetical protein